MHTEGWDHKKIAQDGNTLSNFEFVGTHVKYLYEHLKILLAADEVKVSSVDLLNQWDELLYYSKEFLSAGVTDYMKTW